MSFNRDSQEGISDRQNKIKQLVHAHLHYLKQHKAQLIGIKLSEHIDNGISETEANEYFADTIGITPAELNISKKEFVKEAEDSLNCSLVMFKALAEICDRKETEKNLLLQTFMLEYCHKFSKFIVSLNNRKEKYKINILYEAFNESSELKKLLNLAKKSTPESYKQFFKAIIIESRAFNQPRAIGSSPQIIHHISIQSNQGRFIQDYDDVTSIINKGQIRVLPDDFTCQDVISQINYYSTIFALGSDKFRALPDPKGFQDTRAISNALFELDEKIEALLSLKDLLDTVRAMLQIQQSAEKNKEDTYQALKAEALSLRKELNRLGVKLKKTKQNKIFNQVKRKLNQSITSLNKQLNEYKECDYLDQDACSAMQKDIESAITLIINELKQAKEKANKATALKQKPTAISQTFKKQDVKDETSSSEKSELKNFREKKKLKDEQWRKEVEIKRLEKKQIKLERIISVESSPSPSPSSPSSLPSRTTPSPVLSVNSLFKTIDKSSPINEETLSCRLSQLSKKYLNLMMKIFSGEKGVSYNEVIALIENQLGGTVSEIGNGSSHKRIKLQSLYFEVNSKSNHAESQCAQTPSVATGGLYKPHGKNHNSGFMSRFNLKLVADAFIKAGITPEIIEALKTKQSMPKYQD